MHGTLRFFLQPAKEGNVFAGLCHFVQGEVGNSGTSSLRGGVGISGGWVCPGGGVGTHPFIHGTSRGGWGEGLGYGRKADGSHPAGTLSFLSRSVHILYTYLISEYYNCESMISIQSVNADADA